MYKFTSVEEKIGLSNLNNDKNLYETILKSFLSQYLNSKLTPLEDKEFFTEVHTIKGLAQTIGATKLFEIAYEINNTKNRYKQDLLQSLLDEVINELKEYNFTEENNKRGECPINEDIRINLFKELKESAIGFRPKKVEEALNKLTKYELEDKDLEIVNRISSLLKEYNFIQIKIELEDF